MPVLFRHKLLSSSQLCLGISLPCERLTLLGILHDSYSQLASYTPIIVLSRSMFFSTWMTTWTFWTLSQRKQIGYHTYTIGGNIAYGLETVLTVSLKLRSFLLKSRLGWEPPYFTFPTPPFGCCLLGMELRSRSVSGGLDTWRVVWLEQKQET